MSTTFSLKQPMNLSPLPLCVVALLFAHQVQAEPVRLAERFRDIAGAPFRDFGTVAGAIRRENIAVQAYVKGAVSCRGLLSIQYGSEHGYDRTRDTHNLIFGVKVGCWALSGLDPARPLGATLPSDGLTPEIAIGIMDHLNMLSDRSEEWGKTLLVFPGSSAKCASGEMCGAFWPEGSDLSDYSVGFDLMLVDGDDRFIRVTQSYHGRIDWVYGVRWRNTDTGGEVVEIFPDIDPP